MLRSAASVTCIPYLLGLILIGLPIAASSQTETVLYSFPGTPTDGFQPAGGLVEDNSGNLFGTTVSGSDTLCDLAEVYGCGIVYELVKSPNGYTEKVLYSFGSSSPTSDGASPQAGLIMDALGNLYGTTTFGGYGGSSVCLIDVGVDGCGTVFELVKSSGAYTENLLYTFMGTDGAYPYAGLTMDSSGNLYGTTLSGGACGNGTVFELVYSSGIYIEKVLHSFRCTSSDGSAPYAGLVMDSAGNLYGTTESEGVSGNYGIVFELVNSNGDYTEKVLYNLTGTDGQIPSGNLIFDSLGNLYGTTEAGGEYGNGTVFELANSLGSYTEKVLYSFRGPSYDDGQTPVPGLVMDASGNLFGTTKLGGTDCVPQGCGIVFELVNSSGTYTEKILHRFGAAGDGENPAAPLVMDNAGNLYSTTDVGGANLSGGTVFMVNPTATAPAAILSALSLTFGNQPVAVTSPPQFVTITNSGSANLIFGSDAVTVSGGNATDFTVSANTCSGTAIAPGATCSVTVTFTPSTVGPESASLNFSDNASTSPQTVGLSGTGVTAPPVTLSPSGLVFSSQSLGTTSAAQAVYLTNNGGSPLAITSITVSAVSASFSETNTCGSSLAVGGSCMIDVVFAPTAVGLLTGTLSVADNGANGPQTASLTGTGAAPLASVSPTSVVFGGQIIGTASEAEPITVSNTGNADLTIFSVAISGANSGDFAIVSSGTTCVANGTLTAGSSCAISVMFTPAAGGTRSAILTITDDSYGQTNSNVALSGSGEDFGMAPASGTSSGATVSPGETASYTISVSPQGGFNQTVNLYCAGAPSEATCSVSPNSLLLNGGSASTCTVTVTTTARSAMPYGWRNEGDHRLRVQRYWPWLPVGLLGLCVVIIEAALRRRWEMNPLLRRAMLAMTLASQMMLASCGGGSSSPPQNLGTPPGSYTLTISGTSGSLSHSTVLTLTVD